MSSREIIFGCIAATFILGCPPGTKTSIDLGVQVNVDPQHCKEDRTKPDAPPDLALLDCTSIQGGGTVRILFPRQEWHSIKQRGIGSVDAGPGK